MWTKTWLRRGGFQGWEPAHRGSSVVRRPRAPRARSLRNCHPPSESGGSAPVPSEWIFSARPAPPLPHFLSFSPASWNSCPAAAFFWGPSCFAIPDRPFQNLPAVHITASWSAPASGSRCSLAAALAPVVHPACTWISTHEYSRWFYYLSVERNSFH